VTYSRRVEMRRFTGGRQQHFVEDVIVHEYGRRHKPVHEHVWTLPRPEDVERRYNYYRSRSHGPTLQSRHVQTGPIAPHSSTEETIPTHPRTRSHSQYRSYSSHYYNQRSTNDNTHPQNGVSSVNQLPIVSMLDEMQNMGDEFDDNTMFGKRNPPTVPLETRLYGLSPERSVPIERKSAAPLRRARQRVRNYCAML